MSSAVGAAIPGVYDDAHADNVVLRATTVEHMPAMECEAAEAAKLLGQADELVEWQLELSEVKEAATSGAALGKVGSAWTNVRDRHNHNMRRAGGTAVAADPAPSGPLVYASGVVVVAAL